MARICVEQDVNIGKKVHAFYLRSNDWNIAMLEVYEKLYKSEQREPITMRESRVSGIESIPTVSQALRPLLGFIDGFRRRIAAPKKTLVHEQYANYADLHHIEKRLHEIESLYNREAQGVIDYQPVDPFKKLYNLNKTELMKAADQLDRPSALGDKRRR